MFYTYMLCVLEKFFIDWFEWSFPFIIEKKVDLERVKANKSILTPFNGRSVILLILDEE